MKELIIKKGDKQITVADKEDVMDALDNKSDNTHNHDSTYIKKTGGVSQHSNGNIIIPSNADSTNVDATGYIPFGHTIQDTTKTLREILPTKKSVIGAVISKGTTGNQYDYVISARHRNGSYDGYKYGMYIRAPWSSNGNLAWAESNNGDYGTEKTILDSSNYSTYASPRFDYTHIKGTDNTTGYIKALQLKVNAGYQDKPIAIEIYQRDRSRKSVVNIKFQNINSTDPILQYVTHTNNEIAVYLYKESAGTYSLITSKGYDNKYGEMSIKITNPNPSIAITKLDTHIASLPTGTTNNPLKQSLCIDIVSNSLTDTSTTNALSANQGKVLKELVDGKITNGTGTVTSTNIADKSVTFDKMQPTIFWGGGSGSTAGYIKMIKFKFTSDAQWRDKPITFDLYNRARIDNIHVSLKFKNVGNNDPDVDYFSYTSYNTVNLYLYKEETSTWSLIIQKESNGNMEIANLTIPSFNRDYLAYYNMNTQISALPSNTTANPLIQATQRTYGGTSNNNITAPAFIKSNGQSSQFLKADGSVDTLADNLTTDSSTKALSARQGKWLYDNKIEKAGTNLSKSGTTLNHATSGSGSLTTATLKKVKFDAQGHITGTADPDSVTCTVTYTDGNTSTINLVTR